MLRSDPDPDMDIFLQSCFLIRPKRGPDPIYTAYNTQGKNISLLLLYTHILETCVQVYSEIYEKCSWI